MDQVLPSFSAAFISAIYLRLATLQEVENQRARSAEILWLCFLGVEGVNAG
jgi:hypothetical protein